MRKKILKQLESSPLKKDEKGNKIEKLDLLILKSMPASV